MISVLFLYNQETGFAMRTVIHYIKALLSYDRIHTTAQETAPGGKTKRVNNSWQSHEYNIEFTLSVCYPNRVRTPTVNSARDPTVCRFLTPTAV